MSVPTKLPRIGPNQFRVDGTTVLIALTNRDGIQVADAIVDLEDFARVSSAGRWSPTWHKKANTYYVYCNAVKMSLHRFVMCAPAGSKVDHRNHNTTDCRKENLRLCTHAENMRNRKLESDSSRSGRRNIEWDKKNENWRVRINVDGRRITIGSYRSIADAEVAASEARKQYHGEFAL